MLIMIGQFLMA